jgi:ribosomal protein L11 methylase PrmA
MKPARAVPGSFRDPAGRVYGIDGRIIRTISDRFSADFEFVESTGLFQKLLAQKWLVPFERADTALLGALANNSKYVLEVSPLRFISHPYEWSFPALKAAALLHLEIHLAALEHGVTLSDASAYNIQFHGARPVFIDHLSFRRYRPGEIWAGHRQFCEQFLNPLLLRALLGIPHNAWYRGTQEGIKAQELSKLLKWRHRASWKVVTHILLQSYFQRSVENNRVELNKDNIPAAALPLPSFQRLLKKLHSWISKLHPADRAKTIWQDYTITQSYSSAEAESKRRFVADFVEKEKPKSIWDLGCNTGDYCIAALEAGAEYAVGFDSDQGALESAFARSLEKNLPFQALFFDAANPSPNQGWNEQERSGLRSRASADAVLALAFVHHLAIARNVPLEEVLNWIINLAPAGIIEFVPKSDPMVQSLLRHREDIFSDYTQEAFLGTIDRGASIINTAVVSASGRLLVSYERRNI